MAKPELKLREIWFNGWTYNPNLDRERLKTSLERVFALMADGKWRTLREVADQCYCSEAGASARLRDLRKPRFGGHHMMSRRRDGGLWEYRLVVAWAAPEQRSRSLWPELDP